MTIDEVKQIISNSKFDDGLKKRLVLILPRLGRCTLSGLGKEASRGDALIIADYLVTLWESFANLLDSLKSKNEKSIEYLSKFLEKKLAIFNGEDELYILNFALDVREMADKDQVKLSAGQYDKLLNYEVELFWQLPKDEVLYLLQNHLLFLLQKIQLLEYTQVFVYRNDLDLVDDFNGVFLGALSQNKEPLGASSLRPVGVWIKEFLNFTIPTNSQAGTFGVAEFLSKDSSVQKLAKNEREALSEILKLYVWLSSPVTDENEILAYEDSVNQQKSERRAKDLGIPEIAPVSSQSVPYLNNQKFELPKEFLQTPQSQPKPVPPVGPRAGGSPPPAGVTSNELLVASGEQADNNKTAQLRAALGSQQIMRDSELTLTDSITDADKNQKPRLSQGNLIDSDTMREKSGLLSINRLAQPDKPVNGGGREGNRTPRVMDSKPDSAPHPAHSNELYHSSAQNRTDRTDRTYTTDRTDTTNTPATVMEPLSNVNIQDVLRHQMQNQDGQGGLRMGGGGGSGIRNNELGIRNGGQGGKSLISNPSSLTKTSDVPIVKKPEVVNKAQEIDKKLEDLEKRVKG